MFPIVVSSGLLATGQQTTPAKKGRQNGDQDAQDMHSAGVGCGSPAKGGPTGSPKRKQTRHVGLRAKSPKSDGSSDLPCVAGDSEPLGESALNSLFGMNSEMF